MLCADVLDTVCCSFSVSPARLPASPNPPALRSYRRLLFAHPQSPLRAWVVSFAVYPDSTKKVLKTEHQFQVR